MLDTFFQWLSKLAPEVPEEMAACEFECRKTDCLMGDWLKCERRKQAAAHAPEERRH
ncbi:MAG: hypothetical protein WCH04_19580 [Gammaproteobacteria bacterium]|jgi:hypothetical protein